MGITQVTATVGNPARPRKLWEGLFLVDTGAVDCLVPGRHLRALGLKPRGRRTHELADGSEVTLDVTVAEIEFMGETVGATVIYGPDDAEAQDGMDPASVGTGRADGRRRNAATNVSSVAPTIVRALEP